MSTFSKWSGFDESDERSDLFGEWMSAVAQLEVLTSVRIERIASRRRAVRFAVVSFSVILLAALILIWSSSTIWLPWLLAPAIALGCCVLVVRSAIADALYEQERDFVGDEVHHDARAVQHMRELMDSFEVLKLLGFTWQFRLSEDDPLIRQNRRNIEGCAEQYGSKIILRYHHVEGWQIQIEDDIMTYRSTITLIEAIGYVVQLLDRICIVMERKRASHRAIAETLDDSISSAHGLLDQVRGVASSFES